MSNFVEIVLVKDGDGRLLIRQAPFCTYLSEGDEVIVENLEMSFRDGVLRPATTNAVVLDRISLNKDDEIYRFLLRFFEEKDFKRVLRRISYQDLYKDSEEEESEVMANG